MMDSITQFNAILIALVLIVLAWIHISRAKIREFASKVPGPPKVWILGNLFELNQSNEANTIRTMFEWPKKYGRRFQISFMHQYFMALLDPVDMEKVLSSNVYINKGYEYEFVRGWLGDGLLTSQGSKWVRRRKQLTPSFHFKILEQFIDSINRQSQTFVDLLSKKAIDKKAFDICPWITRCALDIICETAMGVSIEAQKDPDSEYIRAIYGQSTALAYRANRFWLHTNWIWKLTRNGKLETPYLETLHGFTDKVIRERKVEVQARLAQKEGTTSTPSEDDGIFMGKKKRVMAFLDLLLEFQATHPNEISDLEIREETDTFMFEGHDTTSASLAWTVFMLGCYPEHQKKVNEELDSIFGDDIDRDVNLEDLTKMKYLESCIKESLRLYPSVPFIARLLHEDLVLDDGLVIPKGVNVAMMLLATHRDPKYYEAPLEYRPERFFPENSVGRHPYAYVPFSAGPRNCIGQKFALMEEKIILASLFRIFRVKSVEKPQDIVLMTEVILRPKNGIKVTITPRH